MGITRETIITLAGDLGIPVKINDMTKEMLLDADEAFFTGTASEVTPIKELDGEVIGSGKPGELTRLLRSLYFDIVHGKRPEYTRWLHYVSQTTTGKAEDMTAAPPTTASETEVRSA